jgi:mono/diheme cytochrome c family protein
MLRSLRLSLVAGLACLPSAAPAATKETQWADFVEPNFPFFSSVLDARQAGPAWLTNNLTPRGLILNLGQGCWAAFDIDLLRMSAIWSGDGVTPVSMSQGSYHTAGAKAPEGQRILPRVQGTNWLLNGIYPGWQSGPGLKLVDPRPAGPEPNEVGRGPLTVSDGRFTGIRLVDDGVVLEYEVRGTRVMERLSARLVNGSPVIQRSFYMEQVPAEWLLLLGRPSPGLELKCEIAPTRSATRLEGPDGLWFCRVGPSAGSVEFQVAFSLGSEPKPWGDSFASKAPLKRWQEIVVTRAVQAAPAEGCALDNITLPTENPWRRNVRLADLAFRANGEAAFVTYDGDVWLVSGLAEASAGICWRRYASGFHEPLGIAFRNDELFVNDRNGIWRLHDADGNGEADFHELFSNVFTQTAETREFPSGFRVAPDGSFIVAKGGQQTTTVGKDNGSVLRVAPDGRSYSTLGWGLREPFIGVHPKTGLITASDQQGNYVPATPLHVIERNQFYGFLSLLLPKEQYPAPIADALTWIPHAVNPSGASQVWLTDPRAGPLVDAMIHIGYYRPELFLVRWNQRSARAQAAVMSLTRDLNFAPLNGAVNPVDGQLYITGFQIWGTIAREISGLARVRFTGSHSLFPRELVPMNRGILLRFDVALDPGQATNLANYSIERWNYRRTANYGSPHFKLDGSKGQETLFASAAYLSRDARAVFLVVPELCPVMQMRLGWSLATTDHQKFATSAYFTPHELISFEAAAEGFEPVQIDLAARRPPAPPIARAPPTAAEGRQVAELMGCVACHSNDGSTMGKVGPSWKGLFGSKREIARVGKVVADEAYLRESIKEPTAKILKGFENGDVGMPSYEGVLTDAQIEALVLYLKTL